MSHPLADLLQDNDVLMADGGMGTSLFALGLANGAPGELWNIDHPDRVASVHQGFVDAGADIILTNSFGGNRFRLAFHDAAERVAEINQAAARIARTVADAAGRKVLVAGSIGPTGEVLAPLGQCAPADAESAFAAQAAALQAGGVDLAWIETMFSEEELAAAVAAAERVGLPYVMTMTFDSAGRTMMGITPAGVLEIVRRRGWTPAAVGANCGIGPAQLLDSILGMHGAAGSEDVLVAKGNCGTPTLGTDMQPVYDGTPRVMADYACLARDAGARIIGGCCGTTPDHLAAMRAALDERPRGPVPDYPAIEARLGPIRTATLGRDGTPPARGEGRRRRRA
jgi:5-methyltetrahydrofolate--homocysteine methyltransferase